MRGWTQVAPAFLLVLLAGCSDGGGPGAVEGAPSTSLAPVFAAPPSRPLPTDTLHFIGPEMTPVPPSPDAIDPVLVDVPSVASRTAQIDLISRALWFYEVGGKGTLGTVEAHLWIRIDRQLANPYQGPSFCPWGLVVEVHAPNGELVHMERPCIQDGPLVAPGDRELVFTTSNLGQSVVPGSTIGLGLEVGPFDPTAPTAVHLLTGTPAFDTRVTLQGLAEPLPSP